MPLTLQQALTQLLAGTLQVQSGVIAQLTRQIYILPYEDIINYQQFIPILYFNYIENDVTIGDTADLSFSSTDIFSATDWVLLNAAQP